MPAPPSNFGVSDEPQQPTNSIKTLAYGGGSVVNPVSSGQLYRVERGYNFVRAGRYVPATPQFRALTVYSPAQQTVTVAGTGQASQAPVVIQAQASSTQSAQITSKQNVALSVTYPVKAR